MWDAWERIFTDLENPKHKEDAEDFFKANEAEMLEGTAVLWEEKLPYYALMVMRVSEGEASFSSEIQNEPIDPENCAFAEEWFDFYDDGQLPPDFSDPKFLFVAANDPSLGKNRKSDTSAIIGIWCAWRRCRIRGLWRRRRLRSRWARWFWRRFFWRRRRRRIRTWRFLTSL